MSPAPLPNFTGVTDPRAALARALALRPRTIPPRWLYDDRGSQLFDAITRLPEYYQTEAEREILAQAFSPVDSGRIGSSPDAATRSSRAASVISRHTCGPRRSGSSFVL